MKLDETIGEYTVKLDKNNTVTAHRGIEQRYSKQHEKESDAAADFNGLCEYISQQTGVPRPLPPPPDFVGAINWGVVDTLIGGAK